VEETPLTELYRSLDLCFAVAAAEAEPFLRYLWLRPEVRPQLQRLARVALPVVLAKSEQVIPVPDGIVPEEGDASAQADAFIRVSAVARAVVPRVAVYERALAWLEALLELEGVRRLERLALPDEMLGDVRGCIIAYARVRKELSAAEAAFRKRWASHGGWSQLGMILDWEFFRRTWEILRRRHSEVSVRQVVDQIRSVAGTKPLLEPEEIIASHGV
jgi:hypothetical protein